VMSFNLGQKGIPLWSGFSANHQEVGAIFAPEVLAVVKADTLPALVGKIFLSGVSQRRMSSIASFAVRSTVAERELPAFSHISIPMDFRFPVRS